jgi:hypothetical protein
VIRKYSVPLKSGVIPDHFQKDRPVVELQNAGRLALRNEPPELQILLVASPRNQLSL